MHGSVSGLWFYAKHETPQLALMGHPPNRAVAVLDGGQRITLRIPICLPETREGEASGPMSVALRADRIEGDPADVRISIGESVLDTPDIRNGMTLTLKYDSDNMEESQELLIGIAATDGPASLALSDLRLIQGERSTPLCMTPPRRDYPEIGPVACSPAIHPTIALAFIEWDWRMQDGLETPRERRSYIEAVELALERGDQLVADLRQNALATEDYEPDWARLHARCLQLSSAPNATESGWESLWLDVHRLRRKIVLSNRLFDGGPILFVKRVPSTMAHQLTQYYGYTAQPGGGIFVLEQPGRSMRIRQLTETMPEGSYLRPEVSYDAQAIYFGFCPCDTGPKSWRDPDHMDRNYHLYAMSVDGTAPQQLTDGPYDDFSPIELPDGKLLFCSTRRGGYHRCGGGPCYVYTLATVEADGSDPQSVSFHETNEWDPTLLHDGRVVYTRWDYVDRDAVFYQQLWSVRQDGSDVRIFYGNNTFNPVGTWETRPVPGSNRVMATAAAHHAMTAGSIVLLDVRRGRDGVKPITRLTPDALFPESETGLAMGVAMPEPTRFEDALIRSWGPQPRSQPSRIDHVPEEQLRWPGHCYRSPYPLSENYFLAAYSYDPLRGEPGPNRPNMFGLYLIDAFGNKELLYRDPNISSQWPMLLRARQRPPVLKMPSRWAGNTSERPEGLFFLQNVYDSWPKLPDVKIHQLRIVQVLPKTTPNANQPKVGAANASPGKQVLGTVPVENDGSAYFRVPAKTPVLFQALDAQGRAVQTMRSLTYLQPGEQSSCIGCHEQQTTTGQTLGQALALARPPSEITPGPDGSNPLSYPILVQSVLDRHCVKCHNADKPDGDVILTDEATGEFNKSYETLIPYVSFSAWNMPNGNYEPRTEPDRFGARASRLITILDKGHHEVELSTDDWNRLCTWIDANALFYGTFNVEDQRRQLAGETIAGPELE